MLRCLFENIKIKNQDCDHVRNWDFEGLLLSRHCFWNYWEFLDCQESRLCRDKSRPSGLLKSLNRFQEYCQVLTIISWPQLESQDINCRLSKVSTFWKHWSILSRPQSLRNDFMLKTNRRKIKLDFFRNRHKKTEIEKNWKGSFLQRKVK